MIDLSTDGTICGRLAIKPVASTATAANDAATMVFARFFGGVREMSIVFHPP
jgi:hypothetical protein